jgi:hypothetical protein
MSVLQGDATVVAYTIAYPNVLEKWTTFNGQFMASNRGSGLSADKSLYPLPDEDLPGQVKALIHYHDIRNAKVDCLKIDYTSITP